ncbi:MAG TPA: PQQ-dependent dehydrogenase, methanol/ethanol family [Bryobacteraceae bacterium]|nr:PQQ-dependent dehydrogenase, methanol/ethanol family [Bryobacteraceae bacterium]
MISRTRAAIVPLFITGVLLAQHTATIARGRDSFAKNCAACHGANAKGGRAPDLTSEQFKWGATDEALKQNIRKGIAGTQMPAFDIPDAELADLIAFVRSLSGKVTEISSGDPAKGRISFFGAAGCSQCHIFGGRGGRLGPDLTNIASERSLAHLRKSIQDPDAELKYLTVEAVTKAGRTLSGVARSEDTHTLIVMDREERLHSLSKRDLRELRRPRKSMMPKSRLSATEAEDVVAFLTRSDRRPQPDPDWRVGAWNVSYSRLLNAAKEPQNWLTYWGDYAGRHYSGLDQIRKENIANLAVKWIYQFRGTNIEVTPIVADGLMFVTGPLSDAAALDVRTGQEIWRYRRLLPKVAANCTVMTNRGVAVLGDRVFLATLDNHLLALDAKTGAVIWDAEVDDYKKGFSITHAPLAIDGKIIVGVTAGECGLNGFVDAFDAATGKKLWRLWAVAQPGDPARATWSGKSAETGGGPTWMTGTYDPETDTLFWTTGNPSPDYDGTVRLGDNLYTCSVLAINPKTGKLKWHFQFTPHDTHDWDANETPVLIDGVVKGKQRKLLIQANRNAFYYVLDRTTGEFLLGNQFAKQNWADGLDSSGHPIVKPNTDPTPEGVYICPDAGGAANWGSPSYSPLTKLFYVHTREACAIYTSVTKEPVPGLPYTGTGQQEDNEVGNPGFVRAIDPFTGARKWDYPLHIGSSATGVLATAGGIVFAAGRDGHLTAIDAANGAYLWHMQTGGEIKSSPMSFAVDGKQYIAVAADSALFVFALR